jgi:hypothetical protein
MYRARAMPFWLPQATAALAQGEGQSRSLAVRAEGLALLPCETGERAEPVQSEAEWPLQETTVSSFGAPRLRVFSPQISQELRALGWGSA